MRTLTLLFFAIFLSELSGCSAGNQYNYEPSSETPPGPGLLSGEDGVFTIYEKETADDSEKNMEDSVETSR